MKFKLLFPTIFFLFIFSCKKEQVIPTCESQVVESYTPMSVGSYWIYQWYQVDSIGTEELLVDKIDTITILKDTLIGTSIYKKIKENNSFLSIPKTIKYRRDSLGFLVDPLNNIYFSASNFIDTLKVANNNNFKIIYKMDIPTEPVVTTAGTFDCLNFRGEVTPFITVDWDVEFINTYYSKGVGKIQENTFYFSNANVSQFQRRLVEYYLE